MTYDKEQASGIMHSEITFDRVIFMNSLALNGARTNCQCGRSIILEEIWFQYFFSHLDGCLIKNFVSERFVSLRFSFLQFTKGLLREKIVPHPHSTPQHRLPPTLASRLCYGRARTLTQTSNARVVWMMLSSPQAPQPPSPVQGSSWFPRQSLHFSPHLPMSRPKHGSKMACTERDETKALGDAPQAPISSDPRFRRMVTRHQISDQSRLLTLPYDVRSGK